MSHYQPYDQPLLQQSNLPHQTGGYPPQQAANEGLGSWILTVFLTFIPLVNIIYLLVLAFGGSSSLAKRNFARASLIWMVVGIILSIVGFILLAMFGITMFEEISNTYPTEFEEFGQLEEFSQFED